MRTFVFFIQDNSQSMLLNGIGLVVMEWLHHLSLPSSLSQAPDPQRGSWKYRRALGWGQRAPALWGGGGALCVAVPGWHPWTYLPFYRLAWSEARKVWCSECQYWPLKLLYREDAPSSFFISGTSHPALYLGIQRWILSESHGQISATIVLWAEG